MSQKQTVMELLNVQDPTERRLPVEVHCHGFGDIDFSDLDLDLRRLDAACAQEGVSAIPTLYLQRHRLADLETMMAEYAGLRANGELDHIVGMALEGPLMASRGGTPGNSVWAPSWEEWQRLANLGPLGLKYSVMSPDAFTPSSELADTVGSAPGFHDFVPLLVSAGVRPALGHFTRDDPSRSAAMIEEIVHLAWSSGWSGTGVPVITDHLFNDMPLNIRHAFRTSHARARRDATIESYRIPEWSLSGIDRIVGPVPGAIMRNAAAGRIAACINFDGEHVDLEIAKRSIELMETANAMVMTDRCDSARLGGQELHRTHENSLWYQDAGIVAAGSQPLAKQVRNARSEGFTDSEIWQLIVGTPHRAFELSSE